MRILLLPLMLIYQIVVEFRNWLFDIGALASKKYHIPVISVGNITIGGTGKTPHTEYLLSLLSPKMKVAMLSRGYKRKSKGFILANEETSSKDIGDEPFQIKEKFNDVIVAVDNNRCHGIEKLLELPNKEEIGAIVLDDAYQHRYVDPGINILLTDYNRILTKDYLLPVGNLREPARNKKRANIVIVTKCPDSAQPIDFRLITKDLNLYPYQNLYFTKYIYDDLHPVFSDSNKINLSVTDIKKDKYEVLLFSGIVSPDYLTEHMMRFTPYLQNIEYQDHHNYSFDDLTNIANTFETIEKTQKVIITTEKDAARLMHNEHVPEIIKEHLYAIPVKVEFLFDQEKNFNEQILGYVSKNKTNRSLYKK